MNRVKILNDGGWHFLDRVTFPVEVDATYEEFWDCLKVANVTGAELKRIGAKFDWDVEDDSVWSFYIGSECEVLK